MNRSSTSLLALAAAALILPANLINDGKEDKMTTAQKEEVYRLSLAKSPTTAETTRPYAMRRRGCSNSPSSTRRCHANRASISPGVSNGLEVANTTPICRPPASNAATWLARVLYPITPDYNLSAASDGSYFINDLVIHNRDGNESRLRDLTVEIVQFTGDVTSDFALGSGGTVNVNTFVGRGACSTPSSRLALGK